ncbi:oxidoreductase [Nocardioides sp.]|uniref:oxidoreductase n=1 Tax=Nocardioides sp. TaxID=35761 RepID=UPI002736177A|nr:oxidoreductase [Nocardioides sp.]MDP3894172.1 oxidoreductase [Nocardioides sp.]
MTAGRPPRWTIEQMPRQGGRRFVVTGGSGGLGLASARALAAAGARVVLAVRDPAKGEAAARTIRGETEVRQLDVADLESVRSFAATVGPVDVLVNNAGVMGLPHRTTRDGFETQLATNHLGHFALTNLLLPQLLDRVVVVGSHSHRHGSVDLDDLFFERRPYHPYRAYAQSKLANLLFLLELQRRLTEVGSSLRAVGGHPGYTATGIQSNTGNRAFTRLSAVGNRLVGMTPAQGALSVLFAATEDLPGNSYAGPHRAREMNGWPTLVGRSRLASDPGLARRLWERSESLTGTTFPTEEVSRR